MKHVVCLAILLFGFGCSRDVATNKFPGDSPKAVVADDGLEVSVLTIVDGKRRIIIYGLAENKSDTKVVKMFEPLPSGSNLKRFFETGKALGPFEVELTDNFGNRYDQRAFSRNILPPHPLHPSFSIGWNRHRIKPNDFLVFSLRFDSPVKDASMLKMEMPSLVLSSKKRLHFSIPLKKRIVSIAYPPSHSLNKRDLPVLFCRDDADKWFRKWIKNNPPNTF